MTHFLPRLATLLAGACLACLLSLSAHAGPLSDAEQLQVRDVIQAQLDAFAQDDADTAFELATPGIRATLGKSERLLALVREAYPMVYRAASVAYFKAEESNGTVLQLVRITDPHSKSWLAIFSLERQADASWRISGCLVTESGWLSA
ncbi:MAG TPA: DUF4864 domain-containing protein [Burkholderiaceae bacterium]|nr:DUF4864 domain-containing protein [Burkholderiaceae bacterium]